MTAKMQRRALTLVGAVVLAALAPQAAQAYFYFGGFDINNKLIVPKWRFSDLDTNGDGDVGPGEGIPITFEGGDDGWTQSEMLDLEFAFETWERVPSSYVAFRYTAPISDELELEGLEFFSGEEVGTLAGIDFYNLIAATSGDELGAGVLGLTLLSMTFGETWLATEQGQQILVSAGTIIESDIGIAADLHRSPGGGQLPQADLISTTVHEIGHLLGMAHNPMGNFKTSVTGGGLADVEDPVWSTRDNQGRLVTRGVTATMYPLQFFTERADGTLIDGAGTLAPDDISNISALYPRGSQANYFTLRQSARTRSKQGFPSLPIYGGIVVAWADIDDNDATQRVPVFTTQTGLWFNTESLGGHFENRGLWKQFLTPAGTAADTTYTFTIHPLSDQWDTTGRGASHYDATHLFTAPPWDYSTLYPSAVFRDGENLFDRDNNNLGTPLRYDEATGQIVSAANGKSLANMLPGGFPMFGDPSRVCPLATAATGTGDGGDDDTGAGGGVGGAITMGPKALRGLRDNVLLETAAGAAAVDAYYRAAPAMTEFVLDHAPAMNALRWALTGFGWTIQHAAPLSAITFILAAGLALLRVRRSRAAAALLLGAGVVLAASPADARLMHMTVPDIAKASDYIVEGEVESVEGKRVEGSNIIYTEVTVRVRDAVKGQVNKSAAINLRLPGGRVGNLVTHCPAMPDFHEGERAMLFLDAKKSGRLGIVNGFRGKMPVRFDYYAGEAKVHAPVDGHAHHAKSEPEDEGGIALDDFKQYLRYVVAAQRAEEDAQESAEQNAEPAPSDGAGEDGDASPRADSANGAE